MYGKMRNPKRKREPSYFSALTTELFFAGIYRHVRSTQLRLQYSWIGASHTPVEYLRACEENL